MKKEIQTIPFMDIKKQYLQIKPDVERAMQRVFDRSQFILGEEGRNFEQQFASYVGMSYGVGVNSGTDALHLALHTIGVGAGDEVITVANTAIPTVSAIVAAGATPVFVDIEEETMLMDVKKIENVITPQTKAIIPVHLYGNVVAMDDLVSLTRSIIAKIAKKNKIFIIEDCAQAHGAALYGKKAGSFGDISCFSFYPTKNLGAYGDAGLILVQEREIYDHLLLLRQYGEEKRYYTVMNGFNSRLDELQAAVLLAKFPYLDQWNKRRQAIAKHYLDEIKNVQVRLPMFKDSVASVFHLFVVRVKDREHFREHLASKGVSTAVHYPLPLHLQKAYFSLGYKKGDLPITERVMEEVVSIPIFPELSDDDVAYIIDVVNAYKG